MGNEDVACTMIYTIGYYSAIRKKEILLSTITWMELEGVVLSEISQAGKDKYCMVSYMESKIKT